MEIYGQLSINEDIDKAAKLREQANAAEAVLFALGRAVSLSEIAKVCACDLKDAKSIMRFLSEKYKNIDSGICLKEINGKYQLSTKKEYYPQLLNVLKLERKPVLTEVVMETLAVIAYKSPVTKPEIERIRGVKSDHAVNKLIEYGLVEEVGRLNVPGRPALFAPTDEFFRRFDVAGKRDLPGIDPESEARIDEEIKEELKELEEELDSEDAGELEV